MNDGDTFYMGHPIENCYSSGDLTFQIYFVVKASDSDAGNFDILEQCIGDGTSAISAPTTAASAATIDTSEYSANQLMIFSQSYTPAGWAAGNLAVVGFTFHDAVDTPGAEPRVMGLRLHN